MKCGYCGNELREDARFCPHCGRTLGPGAAGQPLQSGAQPVPAWEGPEGVVRVAVLLPLLAEGLKPGVPRPPPCRLKFLGLFHAALLSFSSPGWYNRDGLLPGEGVNTNEGFSV